MKAYRCWIKRSPDLGAGIVLAPNAGIARYVTAVSAAECGYVPRPSPHLIQAHRAPEYDYIHGMKPRHPYAEDWAVSQINSPIAKAP